MIITEDNELLFSVLFERDFSPQDAEALLGFKPNKLALDCVKKSLDIVDNGHKVAMFLKIQFLESKARR